MKKTVSVMILYVAIAALIAVNSFAYSTYVSFSNKSVGTVGTKVTGTSSLSVATYTATVSRNSKNYNLQATLISSNGDKIYYAPSAIFGTGSVNISVKASGSYYLCLNSLGNGSTTVSGYWRSQS